MNLHYYTFMQLRKPVARGTLPATSFPTMEAVSLSPQSVKTAVYRTSNTLRRTCRVNPHASESDSARRAQHAKPEHRIELGPRPYFVQCRWGFVLCTGTNPGTDRPVRLGLPACPEGRMGTCTWEPTLPASHCLPSHQAFIRQLGAWQQQGPLACPHREF